MSSESVESAEIRIEKAKPEDAQGIQEVFYRAWLQTYPNEAAGITTDDIEEKFKDRFSEERLVQQSAKYANPPAGEAWLVAKKGTMVVGLITPVRKEYRNQLQRIYVHPGFQHQGIGTRLWEAAKKHMDMQKDTYVSLVDYNENARRFYESLGFVDTGRRYASTVLPAKEGRNATETEMEMVLKATGSNGTI